MTWNSLEAVDKKTSVIRLRGLILITIFSGPSSPPHGRQCRCHENQARPHKPPPDDAVSWAANIQLHVPFLHLSLVPTMPEYQGSVLGSHGSQLYQAQL